MKDFATMLEQYPELKEIEELLTPSKVQPWLDGRLALSQQSCRFEIPLDVWSLERMTPRTYLTRHAKVSQRRQAFYSKIYLKFKDGKTGDLGLKELEKALTELLAGTATKDDFSDVFLLLNILPTDRVDHPYFSGIAALAERLLYNKFLTAETKDLTDHKKEQLEACDFQNLRSRLYGLTLCEHLERLLYAIRDT